MVNLAERRDDAHVSRDAVLHWSATRRFPLTWLASLLSLAVVGCGDGGSGSTSPSAQGALTGDAFGQPFAARDILLVHPQTWKSAAPGSTAILVSDTPDLCEQITSVVAIAPARFLTIALEQRGADDSVVDLDVGQFVTGGQGAPSSRYGEMFLSRLNAQCGFGQVFSDQSSIQVTAVGPKSSPVSLSVNVHFTSGDSIQGSISAAAGCDEGSVDAYLNDSPKCD
jgi:hypothetical protein